MRFLTLIATISLFSGLTGRAADSELVISVAGSVAKPTKIHFAAKEATLSEAFERAGGIAKTGSDEIRVFLAEGDGGRVKILRGITFYSGKLDYRLPTGSRVLVLECVALGLGNLGPHGFSKLEQARSEYLERKRSGKIELTDLFSQ